MNFNTLEELKDRVDPALEKRVSDLNILGYNIAKEDIWDNLAINKWKNEVELCLSDMVEDILKYIPKMDGDDKND